METASNVPTKAGTAGGTLLVLLHISSNQVLDTALMAAIGAAVSFLVTLGLRWLINWVKMNW